MKKTIRKYLSCVALLLVFVMMFSVLSGCKKNDTDPAGTDETNDSSVTTVAGETPKFPEACDDHKGDFICVNCGRRLTPDGFFTSVKASDAVYTVVLSEVDVTVPVNEQPVNVKITDGELSLSANGEKLNGYGHVVGSATIDGKVTSFDQTVSVKDSVVYFQMSAKQNGAASSDNGEENVSVYLPLEVLSELLQGSMGSSKDPAFAEKLMEKLPDLMEKEFLPMIQAFLAAHPELEDICARIADLFWTVRKTDNGYEISLSLEKIAALNDKLNTMKVSEFVDLILGEGKFAELETYANGIFDKKVSELLADVKAQGIDVERILKAVDSLMPAVDDKGNTQLTEVLAMLKDEDFLAKTVKDLMLQDKPNDVTDEAYLAQMKQQINTVFAALENTTVWGIIEDAMNKGNGDVNKPYNADAATDVPAVSMHDKVAAMLEQVKVGVTVTFTTDVWGTLTGAKLEWNLPELIGKGSVEITTKHTSAVDYDKIVNEISADVKKVSEIPEKLATALDTYLKTENAKNSVTYDAATGIATVTYIVTADYRAEGYNYDFVHVTVTETNVVTAKVNLKKLLGLASMDGVFIGEFGLEDLENNMTWTAAVESGDTTKPADKAMMDQLEKDDAIQKRTIQDMVAFGFSFTVSENGTVTVFGLNNF